MWCKKNKLLKEVIDLIKQTNKIIYMYLSMIVALLLGVYGQDISYFIADNILGLLPVYYLTAVTIISIFLFLRPYIIVLKFKEKQKFGEKQLALFFLVNTLVGTITSFGSLFALIMWWG